MIRSKRGMAVPQAWLGALGMGLGCFGCGTPAHAPTQTPTSAIAASAPLGDTPAQADLVHGVAVEDPSRWLEPEKDAKVVAWMTEKDAHARASLSKLAERTAFIKRLEELYFVDEIFAPVVRGAYTFLWRRPAKIDKTIVYVRKGNGKERELLNPNTWSLGENASLGRVSVSPDGKRVAYAVRANNSDEATLYVTETESGKASTIDVIAGAKYAAPSWTPSGDAFYYTWLPTDPAIEVADRPGYAEARLHVLGTDPKNDAVIVPKLGDPTKFQGVDMSWDGRWLIHEISNGWTSTDLRFRKANGKPDAWTPLAVGINAHFSAVAHQGAFYVLTDDGAAHGRVMRVDPAKPERAHWVDVVPERKGVTIDSMRIFGGKLFLHVLTSAVSGLELWSLDGKTSKPVALGGLSTVDQLSGTPVSSTVYATLEGFTTPRSIERIDVNAGTRTTEGQVKVPFDAAPYVTEQVRYRSKDGTEITMFIVRKKGLDKTGKTPTLLNGYGGFLVSKTPVFRSGLIPWLERGGIYAMPNLRGGGEYGERWHQEGMLLKKQNVFDDFIAAAEYLIREGYTSPKHLGIQGGSNGGLLVGAAMTQRPDLYGAVICAVPLLDMVRYHLFGSGKTWTSEYGSAEDPTQFKALHAYSPYHRISTGKAYPPLLMLSADHDDRVDPMHARKFVDRIEKAGATDVLLRIEKNAGHGGADKVTQTIEMNADQYAFLWDRLTR